MTNTKRIAVAYGLMWLVASAAMAWTPSECAKELHPGWAEHAQRIQTAEPGSPIYAPKPYPKTEAEIIEDFRYGFLLLLGDNDLSDQPAAVKTVFDGLESGDLKFEIDRIENWSLTRCQPTREKAFYHLVRVYLPDGETEIARGAVNEDGLLGAWQYRPEDEALALRWSEALRSPKEIQSEVARATAIRGSQAQWVQTSGTVRCSLFEPCVALRGKGRTYVVDRLGGIHEVRDEGPRVCRQQATEPAARSALMETLHDTDGSLISIGADFAVTERVGQIDPLEPGPRPKS